jgi:hypothetical protein
VYFEQTQIKPEEVEAFASPSFRTIIAMFIRLRQDLF